MKKITLFLFALSATALLYAQNIQSITVGTALPQASIKMKDVSGAEVSIKDASKQNGVLVMFSCNTCPYVIKNQERTKEIAAYAKQNNIGVIAINSNVATRNSDDSYAAMQAYAKNQSYDFFYAVDSDTKIADAFGATRTPELFLFDAKGVLKYKGAIDDNPSEANNVKRVHAKEAIKELLEGKDISVKESKSVGCTIKRNS